MAKRPIYWARVDFQINNKKNIRKSWKDCTAKIFVTTEELSELNNDEITISRLCRSARKNKKDVDVLIKKVQVITQHGETTDRF